MSTQYQQNSHPDQCPLCSGTDLIDRGRIVHAVPADIAGVEVDLSGIEYRLRACQHCKFQFKDPAIEKQMLMDCYERSTFDHWESSPDPYVRKFDRIRDLVTRYSAGRRILDVGCFNGALLQYFGAEWQRFGIEPSAAAARVATQRGVQILGESLEDREQSSGQFDAVMAIDVLEHIVDPIPFYRLLKGCLKPGGILLISTGNSAAFHWRLQGGLYYYCRFPEHVAFYSKPTFDFIGRELDLRCATYEYFCHKRFPRSKWVTDLAKNMAYTAICKAKGFGVPTVYRKFSSLRGPAFLSSTDHIMYLYQLPEE